MEPTHATHPWVRVLAQQPANQPWNLNSNLPFTTSYTPPEDAQDESEPLRLEISLHTEKRELATSIKSVAPTKLLSKKADKYRKKNLPPTLVYTVQSSQRPVENTEAQWQPLQVVHAWRSAAELYQIGIIHLLTILPPHCTIKLTFQKAQKGVADWWSDIHDNDLDTHALNSHRHNYADHNLIGMAGIAKTLLLNKHIRTTLDWTPAEPPQHLLPTANTINHFHPTPKDPDNPQHLPWQIEQCPGAPAFYIQDRTTKQTFLSNLKAVARDRLQQAHRQVLTTTHYKALRWLEGVTLSPKESRALLDRSRRDQKTIALMHAGVNKCAYRSRLTVETLDK